MPLYNFFCKKCNSSFESYLVSWKHSDPSCRVCGRRSSRLLGKSNVYVPIKTSTPIDIGNNMGAVARIPIISDKNTGRNIGTGSPEFLKG